MIIHTCPYTNSGPVSKEVSRGLGKVNLIALHRTRLDFVSDHVAPLSLKYVLHGAESYEVDGKHLTVDATNYLVINREQNYSSSIESPGITTSYCVFFGKAFVRDGCSFLHQSPDTLLDDPLATVAGELFFYQQLHWRNESVKQLLSSAPGVSAAALEVDQWCALLLATLLDCHQVQQARWKGVSVVKASSRREIARRVSRAADFIQEFYHQDINLDQLAEVALMSRFHFLRSFKECFAVTPHHYLVTTRLQRVEYLLKYTTLNINELGEACGFQDASSFVRLFKKVNRQTPMQFRNNGI